jgi:hypothetical protein
LRKSLKLSEHEKANTVFCITCMGDIGFCTKKNSIRVSYRNGFAINIEALSVLDIKLTYSHRLAPKLYFEGMLSYNFPCHFPEVFNNQFSFIHIHDPSFYYGRIQLRAGAKYYLKPRFYLGGDLLYNNGRFDKKDHIIYPNVGDYYTLKRYKNDLEILAKCGWTWRIDHLLIDIYMGVGYRFKFLHDIVYETSLSGDYPDRIYDPPRTLNVFYGTVPCQYGIQVGYCW